MISCCGFVADRAVVIERRDAEFGAVPTASGDGPGDPGQPGAVRRRGGVGVEVRTGDQDPDRDGVVRSRTVQRAATIARRSGAPPAGGGRPVRTTPRLRGGQDEVGGPVGGISPGAGVSGTGSLAPDWRPPAAVQSLIAEVREHEPARQRQVRLAAVLVALGSWRSTASGRRSRLIPSGPWQTMASRPPSAGRDSCDHTPAASMVGNVRPTCLRVTSAPSMGEGDSP